MDPDLFQRTVQHTSGKQAELSAAAVLFDEGHSRGFKKTVLRHTSPENSMRQDNFMRTQTAEAGGAMSRSKSYENTNRVTQTNFAHRMRQTHIGDPKEYA